MRRKRLRKTDSIFPRTRVSEVASQFPISQSQAEGLSIKALSPAPYHPIQPPPIPWRLQSATPGLRSQHRKCVVGNPSLPSYEGQATAARHSNDLADNALSSTRAAKFSSPRSPSSIIFRGSHPALPMPTGDRSTPQSVPRSGQRVQLGTGVSKEIIATPLAPTAGGQQGLRGNTSPTTVPGPDPNKPPTKRASRLRSRLRPYHSMTVRRITRFCMATSTSRTSPRHLRG